MRTTPLILRHELDEELFSYNVLSSEDFDYSGLKNICRSFGLSPTGRKQTLVDRIVPYILNQDREQVTETIIRELILRERKWCSIKIGEIRNPPALGNPSQLIFEEGEPIWYGPIEIDEPGSGIWYIRPNYPIHWEKIGQDDINQVQIRWLFLANILDGIISFHWHGFTFASERDFVDRPSQYPYWSIIPERIHEFEQQMNIELAESNLHNLVLFDLWEQYRSNPDYTWEDEKIRAESGGVSLNATSSYTVDLDIGSIRNLAQTLRNSVGRELRKDNIQIPNNANLDESILRTLIREFGTKSYKFALLNGDEKIFRAHIYFGMQPTFDGPDKFPHINFLVNWNSPLNQLNFLINHL